MKPYSISIAMILCILVCFMSFLGVSKGNWVCKDLSDDCKAWAASGACKNQKRVMKQYCAKTCDVCAPPAPPIPQTPSCAKTTYGCCWDNSTVAKGPADNLPLSQCPPCLNRRSKSFCTNFKSDCDSKIPGQGDVMRKECPTTCQVPCDTNLNVNNCNDKTVHCFSWFRDGLCQTNKEGMRVYCPHTCGFC